MLRIIVHGGAGAWNATELPAARDGLRQAVLAGYRLLQDGAPALDACESAVKSLEDNPLFNAGTGSVLTLDGRCEMDACIMRGSDLAAGAVAGLERVRNPIAVARKVMEETPCVLLVGDGAQRFARAIGFPDYDPVLPERAGQHAALIRAVQSGTSDRWATLRRFLQEHPGYLKGTVGCVALDSRGGLAAGTSTGGMFLKMLGRIGDSPIIGAGTYANPWSAASCTGVGEGIMRTLLAFRVVEGVRSGLAPQEAVVRGLNLLDEELPTEAGVIALDRNGRWGYATNAPAMPVAVMSETLAGPLVV
jgi:beta-aspartyl-peptidase (threonine type)